MKNAYPHARKNLPHFSHLHRNPCGVWRFRPTIDGRAMQRSLRAKDRAMSAMRASALDWQWSATQPANPPTIDSILRAAKTGRSKKLDAEFPNGTQIKGIDTGDGPGRAKDFMSHVESIGMIPPELQPPRLSMAPS